VGEWIERTGQAWKLNLGIAWIVTGILLLVVAIVAGSSTPTWLIAAFAFAVAGFCWTALAVRCPACRRRIVLWAMLYEPGHGWLLRMMRTDRCPACEDRGTP
jgi:hypothetical protein